MTTHRNDVDDDVIPEFDFSRGVPNPFVGLIGPNYRIYSHGEGPERQTHSVISSRCRGRDCIEFVDLGIAPRRVARFKTEWVAREAIGRFLGIESSTFDLIIDVWMLVRRSTRHGGPAGLTRMIDTIPADWLIALAPAISVPSFRRLVDFVATERAGTDAAIYSPETDVFTALRLTPGSGYRRILEPNAAGTTEAEAVS